jgi:predicted nucleotidyltransferase
MAEINASILNSVKTFLDQLKERGVPVEAAYLFGSYAKGREKEWSDIDVAIIFSNISDDRFEERIRFTKRFFAIDSRIEPVQTG